MFVSVTDIIFSTLYKRPFSVDARYNAFIAFPKGNAARVAGPSRCKMQVTGSGQ